MTLLAQYWHLWHISLGSDRLRFRSRAIPTAQAFCQEQYQARTRHSSSDSSSASPNTLRKLQTHLLSQFRRTNDAPSLEATNQSAQAGLCLRCYVSSPILKACQKIDSLFSGNKAFSYRDLLPFVLNDDGKQLVLLAEDGKTQCVLQPDNQLKPSTFKLFSVEVLRTYQDTTTGGMSLDNWAFLRTKQHPELKTFLSEFGFKSFSDWTLINRIQVNQRERLSERDRLLVDVFHQVYRRDRRKQGKVTRCEDPTDSQLSEMNHLLEKEKAGFSSSTELFSALKQVAKQLRQFDIWQAREPLEVKDMETGDYRLRTDLPANTLDEDNIEEQDFIAFLRQQDKGALTQAIEQSVQSRLAKLKKSKRYSPFASCYVSGLLRYYQEGLGLKEIGIQLGMNNWDQTRRILNPGELLSQVRLLTGQQLLSLTLERAQAKGLIATPPEPDQLKQLMAGMESFLDEKYFIVAAAELKTGKNRSFESDYAQLLIQYLSQCNQ